MKYHFGAIFRLLKMMNKSCKIVQVMKKTAKNRQLFDKNIGIR